MKSVEGGDGAPPKTTKRQKVVPLSGVQTPQCSDAETTLMASATSTSNSPSRSFSHREETKDESIAGSAVTVNDEVPPTTSPSSRGPETPPCSPSSSLTSPERRLRANHQVLVQTIRDVIGLQEMPTCCFCDSALEWKAESRFCSVCLLVIRVIVATPKLSQRAEDRQEE